MLKDQLVKTSAFQFDNWVRGPKLFLALSRPQICIMGEIFPINPYLHSLSASHSNQGLSLGLYKVACVFKARINPQLNRPRSRWFSETGSIIPTQITERELNRVQVKL